MASVLSGNRNFEGRIHSEAKMNFLEKAALSLTEAVTLISRGGVPDNVWDDGAANFDDVEMVKLLMPISTINVWKRLAVATHKALPDGDTA